MAPPTESSHHHRNTTKSAQRPFKSRHSTKSAIRDAAKGMPSYIRSDIRLQLQVKLRKIAGKRPTNRLMPS